MTFFINSIIKILVHLLFVTAGCSYFQFVYIFRTDKRVDELGSTVAFHAKTGSAQYHMSFDQTILFSDVTQNFGNGYDPSTGIFTCPKSGLYFFSLTIYAGASDDDLNVYDSGTNTVILHLKHGDKIWPKVDHYYGWGTNNYITLYGDHWSTFTGFLIKEV